MNPGAPLPEPLRTIAELVLADLRSQTEAVTRTLMLIKLIERMAEQLP